MIKLEHVVCPSPEQMEFVIEGMRNPMNSWDKSDSYICNPKEKCVFSCERFACETGDHFNIGNNDKKLMDNLAAAGTDHRKFMRMMPVMVRITAPLYWWKEFDTYKVGTVANSCSTMHKITAKEFTLEDFSTDQLMSFGGIHDDEREVPIIDFSPLRDESCVYSPLGILEHCTIPMLNECREKYLDYASRTPRLEWDRKTKQIWWQMIQLLPSSYNQTRNVMLNYEVLNNMYHSRKDHKLDEWRNFCRWMKALPYSELITGDLPQEEN